MFGCPHCKTWLHEECLITDIKAKLLARLLDPNSDPLPSTEPVPEPEPVPVPSIQPTDDIIMPDAAAPTTPTENEPEKLVPKTKGVRGAKKSLLVTAVEAAASPPPSTSVILAVAPSSTGKKGKGKNSPAKKPTIKEIDQWFHIAIKPDKNGATKALIHDTRVQEGEGKGFWEEDVMCLLCDLIVA